MYQLTGNRKGNKRKGASELSDEYIGLLKAIFLNADQFRFFYKFQR